MLVDRALKYRFIVMIKYVTNPSKSFHLSEKEEIKIQLERATDEKRSLHAKVSLKRFGCLMLSNFCSWK